MMMEDDTAATGKRSSEQMTADRVQVAAGARATNARAMNDDVCAGKATRSGWKGIPNFQNSRESGGKAAKRQAQKNGGGEGLTH